MVGTEPMERERELVGREPRKGERVAGRGQDEQNSMRERAVGSGRPGKAKCARER